jgi:RNA recognition motif-containing protein
MTSPDGRSKGCGIVEYSTVDEAKKAVLTLNDTELNGRQIFVREDREERGSRSANRFSSDETAQSRRVYVGNLSWDVAWQDLKDHMVSAIDYNVHELSNKSSCECCSVKLEKCLMSK